MAKKIKSLHDRINLHIRKGQTGYFSPPQIDDEIFAEINNLWRKYVRDFEKTRIINTYLNPFIKTEDATPNGTTGIVTLTKAWHYPVGVRVKANGKDVKELDQARWDKMVNHPIEFPTADYPICKFENKQIVARPVSIGELTISYIEKPVKQNYAFTTSGGRYIYDDNASTDVEIDEILHDDIMMRVLANLGIPMREDLLIRVGESNKQMEGM